MKLLSKAAAVSCAALILLAPGTGCWTALAGDFAASEAEGLPAEGGVMALPGAQEMPLGAALPIETLGADAQIPNLSGISGARLPRVAAEAARSPIRAEASQTPSGVFAARRAAQPAQAAIAAAEPGAEQTLRAKTLILRRQTILGRIAAAVKTAISRKGRAQSAASARLDGERTFDGLGAVSRAADASAEASEAPSKISIAARPRGASAGALKASTPADGAAYAAPSVPPAVHGAVVPAVLAMSVGVGFLHVGLVAGAVVAGMLVGGYIGRKKGLASRDGGGGGYWDFGTPLYTAIGGLIGAGVGGIAGAVLLSLHAVTFAALGAGLLHAALPGVGGAVLGAVLGGYLGVKKAKADGGGGGYFNIGPALYGGLGALLGAAVLGTAAAVLGAHFLGAHAAAHAAAISMGASAPHTFSATFMGFPPGWSAPAAQAYIPSQGQVWAAAIKGMLPALKVYATAAIGILGAVLSVYAALLLTELRGLKAGKSVKKDGSPKTPKA